MFVSASPSRRFGFAAFFCLSMTQFGNDLHADVAVLEMDDDAIVEEDDGSRNLVLRLSRSGDTESSVQVRFDTLPGPVNPATPGLDYEERGWTIELQPGELNKFISVPVLGDTADELDEQVQVRLSGEVGLDTEDRLDPTSGFRVGAAPTDVAIADFNGDGAREAVTINSVEDTLSFIGIDGFKGLLEIAPAGHYPTVETGDFNEDGAPDLLITSSNGSSASVWLNMSSSFEFIEAPGSPHSLGGPPRASVLGDFNGDSDLDFAVASRSGMSVDVLLGDGQGEFAPHPDSPFNLYAEPSGIDGGDVNGDGVIDLVLSHRSADGVSLFFGDGAGGFQEAPGSPFPIPADSDSHDLSLGDIDSDGDLDLVVANGVGSDTDRSASILWNTGNGDFQEDSATRINTGSAAKRVVVDDVTSDGNQDVVFSLHGEILSVFLGDGSGDFTKEASESFYLEDAGTRGVAIGDLTGDGLPEIVATNEFHDDVTIVAGSEISDFTPAGNHPVALEAYPHSLELADIDSDGWQDALISTEQSVLLLSGGPEGNFTEMANSPIPDSGSGDSSVAVGDMTGDGLVELVKGSETADAIWVREGNGAGVFTELDGSPIQSPRPASILLADVAGDSGKELVSLEKFGSEGQSAVHLYGYSDAFGLLELGSSPLALADYASRVSVADVNGDGSADLVTGHGAHPLIRVYVGDGNGNFQPHPAGTTDFDFPAPSSILPADVDHDGDTDLLVGRKHFDVKVLVNDGSGAFTVESGPEGALYFAPTTLAYADFSGDGQEDLVLGGGNLLELAITQADGSFPLGAKGIAGRNTDFDVADIDHDGDLDVVFVKYRSFEGQLFTVLNAPDRSVAIVGDAGTGTILDDDLMSVSGMAPLAGPADGGLVSVFGNAFSDSAIVEFGGQPASDVSVASLSELVATTADLVPGSLNDTYVTLPGVGGNTPEAPLFAGVYFADFLDVPGAHQFHDRVEGLVRNGITSGCGGGRFCVDDPVNRGQMAVFLLRGLEGGDYTPPACSGEFDDVPCPGHPFARWIEELSARGITAGCAEGRYCPESPVTRAHMAAFLLRTVEGDGYLPPACSDGDVQFGDVPASHAFCRWVEELVRRGVTGGCEADPPKYCPADDVTRGEMSAFLGRNFDIPVRP